MKKWISLLLAAILVMGMCPRSVRAADGQIVAFGNCGMEGDNVTWTLDDTGLLTISGTGEMGGFNYAPWYTLSYNRVVIEPGITGIRDYAFEKGTDLIDVQIPEGVRYIGTAAFWGCRNLKRISIPDSVTEIGTSAFWSCTSLSDVELPAGLTIIRAGAFGSCALTEIVIPAGITAIGESAFENCDALTSVTLPEGLTYIGDSAFADCDALVRLEIPASVSEIHRSAFDECDALAAIVVDENNPYYSSDDEGTLYNKDWTELIRVVCSIQGEYVVVDGVEKIGPASFYRCNNLTSVIIPESVTAIGFDAFRGCEALSWAEIPASVTDIAPSAFYYCENLTDIYFGGTENQWYRLGDGIFDRDVNVHFGSTEEPPRPERPEIESLLAEEWEVLARVNRARLLADKPALTVTEQQLQMSDIRAEELAQRLEYTRPNGSYFNTVGPDVMAENILAGPETAEEAVAAWMDRTRDSGLILSADYHHMAVGYAAPDGDPNGPYWEQLFFRNRGCYRTYMEVNVSVIDVELGTDLNDLKLWAKAGCLNCGTCYLPILAEYCTGYDPNTPGEQTVSVSVLGNRASFRVDVADPNASDPEPEPEPEPQPDPEPEPEPEPPADCGLTGEEVYQRIIALKEAYPEGMSWTNDDSYFWSVNNTMGYGCAAFAFLLSDSAFGDLPVRAITEDITIDDVNVGDVVYLGGKYVVILEVYEDHVVLTEGSYNNTVHWGRICTAEELRQYAAYVYTRYPAHTFEDGVCLGCGALEETDEPAVLTGDLDNSGAVDSDDAIHLLYHTLFGDVYPINQPCDYNGSGVVDSDDAIYLLYHTLFGDALYPLNVS